LISHQRFLNIQIRVATAMALVTPLAVSLGGDFAASVLMR